jgi:cyanophycin synthetase
MNFFSRHLLSARRYYALARRVLTKKPQIAGVSAQFYREYWLAAARELGADITDLGEELFRITKDTRSTLVQYHHLNIDTYLNFMLVAQKPFIYNFLCENGYKVPRYLEYELSDLEKASSFMNAVKGRCVVKPRSGSGGMGITTGVANGHRLKQASIAAMNSTYGQRPMIEEEIAGDSFRLLFLDGSLIHAIKRCRPSVVGDGKSTIRKLIDKENWERLNLRPIRSLVSLNMDLDCRFYLKDNDLTLDAVPPAGEVVFVKNVANENSSRDNFAVKNKVHPHFHKLGKHFSSVLGIKLIGLDIMSTDISVSLDESGGVINELNIPPGLHYHELIANREGQTNVATQILDHVLSGSDLQISVPVAVQKKVGHSG